MNILIEIYELIEQEIYVEYLLMRCRFLKQDGGGASQVDPVVRWTCLDTAKKIQD